MVDIFADGALLDLAVVLDGHLDEAVVRFDGDIFIPLEIADGQADFRDQVPAAAANRLAVNQHQAVHPSFLHPPKTPVFFRAINISATS